MYSRQLDSFIEVANAGSFTRAAKALYIAPSSLIQQIDLLEQRLEVTLFERGPRGVKLTQAGESIYRDAKELIRLSDEAVARARQITGQTAAVRVAMSLLMKCRMLPDIWARMIEGSPKTRIEIVSLEKNGTAPGNYLHGLGGKYDVMEGLYLSNLYDGRCTFVELARIPFCLAVSRHGPMAKLDAITKDSLEGLDIVTIVRNVSSHCDAVRDHLEELGAGNISDVPHYTMELFADCVLNNRAIITPSLWSDIHPELALIPLDAELSIPYGLIFAKQPNKQARRLMEYATQHA